MGVYRVAARLCDGKAVFAQVKGANSIWFRSARRMWILGPSSDEGTDMGFISVGDTCDSPELATAGWKEYTNGRWAENVSLKTIAVLSAGSSGSSAPLDGANKLFSTLAGTLGSGQRACWKSVNKQGMDKKRLFAVPQGTTEYLQVSRTDVLCFEVVGCASEFILSFWLPSLTQTTTQDSFLVAALMTARFLL